ncbi:MAG: type II toxin-antitoxin system YoeB family toxin [Dorea sp.]|nr:type II toxin-antitoxin system YoeB family toxin [Dorea sp.]
MDESNRIVYKIEENMLLISECKNHYSDK